VYTHRNSFSVPIERNGHGRLSGGVADGREGNELFGPLEALERILRGRIEGAERHRWFAESGSEPDIMS
jgi:hypothetical protein